MGITALLVVEDAFFQRSLADNLKKVKVSVITAGNKFEALEACTDHDIDLALLDIRYQGNDAMQILASLKKSHPGTEVILISNEENIALSMAGMQQGADDDIIVPFDTGVLAKKIRAALKRIRARSKVERKTSLFSFFENTMMAATFAEAGEFDTAEKIFRGNRQKGSHKEKQKATHGRKK